MILRSIALLFISLLGFTVHAQTEKHNQYNPNGKKQGKWTNMLDENWEYVEDSSKAVFYRYTYYENGTNLYPMGPCGGKGYKLEPTPDTAGKEEFILLDGKYKWYDGKGRLSSEHILQDGNYVSVKEYFKNGQVQQYFDYTFDCEGYDHGYLIHTYRRSGKKKGTWPYCPVNGKWLPTRQ